MTFAPDIPEGQTDRTSVDSVPAIPPTPPKRGKNGQFLPKNGVVLPPGSPAIKRFAAKCEHDPVTGCVNWKGGQTAGQGHHVPYGAFWFEGRRWFAHRWAARHIHGLNIDDHQVDHDCRNTLCVQHLVVQTPAANRELQWIRIQVGADPYPYPEDVEQVCEDGIPFYAVPGWLAPHLLEPPEDPF